MGQGSNKKAVGLIYGGKVADPDILKNSLES